MSECHKYGGGRVLEISSGKSLNGFCLFRSLHSEFVSWKKWKRVVK